MLINPDDACLLASDSIISVGSIKEAIHVDFLIIFLNYLTEYEELQSINPAIISKIFPKLLVLISFSSFSGIIILIYLFIYF